MPQDEGRLQKSSAWCSASVTVSGLVPRLYSLEAIHTGFVTSCSQQSPELKSSVCCQNQLAGTHRLAPSTLHLSIKRASFPSSLSPPDLFKHGCRFGPIFPLTALKIHSELCRDNWFTGGISNLSWVQGWPAFVFLKDKLTHA